MANKLKPTCRAALPVGGNCPNTVGVAQPGRFLCHREPAQLTLACLSGHAPCRRDAGLANPNLPNRGVRCVSRNPEMEAKNLTNEPRCLSPGRCHASTFWTITQRPKGLMVSELLA
ncbi:hypothetical protein [Spirosoma areae]